MHVGSHSDFTPAIAQSDDVTLVNA